MRIKPYFPLSHGVSRVDDRKVVSGIIRAIRNAAYAGAPHGFQPPKKEAAPRQIGRTKGGLNSKLYAVCDADGRPIMMVFLQNSKTGDAVLHDMTDVHTPSSQALVSLPQ